jgi:hypothetical protein
MAVIIKTPVFCDVMPCSFVHGYQYFGETCHLYFQGRRLNMCSTDKGYFFAPLNESRTEICVIIITTVYLFLNDPTYLQCGQRMNQMRTIFQCNPRRD